MMVIDTKFNIKDIVYLVTDSEQRERIVTCIVVKENSIMYELVSGTESTWHNDFEITVNKDILKTTNN